MSDILMYKQMNSIKRSIGWSDPPRLKLLNRSMHMCPGNIRHVRQTGLSPIRAQRVFDRHVGNRHKAYVLYWRSHPEEYRRYISK